MPAVSVNQTDVMAQPPLLFNFSQQVNVTAPAPAPVPVPAPAPAPVPGPSLGPVPGPKRAPNQHHLAPKTAPQAESAPSLAEGVKKSGKAPVLAAAQQDVAAKQQAAAAGEAAVQPGAAANWHVQAPSPQQAANDQLATPWP